MATTPYPFDPTGAASSNLVTGETQVISPSNEPDFDIVVPRWAPFFSESLSLVFTPGDSSPSYTMVRGVDYICTHVFIMAGRSTAHPIYGSIGIMNQQIAGTITMTYRTLGGTWTLSTDEIAQILADRVHNPRISAWEEVTGLPNTFPPSPHEWNLVDMVGMADVQASLDGIAAAILNSQITGFAAHLVANNPHGITPAQIGAYTIGQVDTIVAGIAGSTSMTDHLADPDPHTQYYNVARLNATKNAARDSFLQQN